MEVKTGGGRAGEKPDQPKAVQVFDKIFDAALVEYLGKETEPPKDVVAWVLPCTLIGNETP